MIYSCVRSTGKLTTAKEIGKGKRSLLNTHTALTSVVLCIFSRKKHHFFLFPLSYVFKMPLLRNPLTIMVSPNILSFLSPPSPLVSFCHIHRSFGYSWHWTPTGKEKRDLYENTAAIWRPFWHSRRIYPSPPSRALDKDGKIRPSCFWKGTVALGNGVGPFRLIQNWR